MKDHIAEEASYGRRAVSYWFSDGLEEIVLGIGFLIAAAAAFLWGAYAPAAARLAWLAVLAVVVCCLALKRRIVGALKSRITYPRTGYAQPPEEIERLAGEFLTVLSLRPEEPAKENVTLFGWRTVGVLLFFVVFLVEPLVVPGGDAQPAPRWLVPLLMAALAATLYAVNRKSEHPCRWWSALALGLMGLATLLVDVPPFFEPWLPLFLGGLWLVARGGYTLILYLRANPLPRSREGFSA